MEAVAWIGGIAVVIYLMGGGIIAGYEAMMSDDPFSWELMFKWPLRLMGKM